MLLLLCPFPFEQAFEITLCDGDDGCTQLHAEAGTVHSCSNMEGLLKYVAHGVVAFAIDCWDEMRGQFAFWGLCYS